MYSVTFFLATGVTGY